MKVGEGGTASMGHYGLDGILEEGEGGGRGGQGGGGQTDKASAPLVPKLPPTTPNHLQPPPTTPNHPNRPQPPPASLTGHKVVELSQSLPQALGHTAAASETNGAASETTPSSSSDRPRRGSPSCQTEVDRRG